MESIQPKIDSLIPLNDNYAKLSRERESERDRDRKEIK